LGKKVLEAFCRKERSESFGVAEWRILGVGDRKLPAGRLVVWFAVPGCGWYFCFMSVMVEKISAPQDASWGERYFHMLDPDGHELSFARPLK